MPQYQYRLVNVFVESASATFGGNPLCVFEDARGLSAADMQALAAQFNLSETTFILPAAEGSHEPPTVRIFTPLFEMPFAGHPTIGTAHVAHALGLNGCTGAALTLRMKAGDIAVSLDEGAWTFTANAHRSRPSGIAQADVAKMLGLSQVELQGEARYVDAGSEQLVIMLSDPGALARVKPDAALLQQWVRTKLDRYLAYVVARVADDDATHGTTHRFQVRFFFPTKSGLTEDPGTGSACANLGGYLLDAGEPTPSQFTVTQGEFINRLNVLQLSLTAEKRVRVGGRVLELGRGVIDLP
jgi:trans-2,3-dihydro-3-hydroxyanthranilate isomerase